MSFLGSLGGLGSLVGAIGGLFGSSGSGATGDTAYIQRDVATTMKDNYIKYMPEVLSSLSGMAGDTPSYINRLMTQEQAGIARSGRSADAGITASLAARGMLSSGQTAQMLAARQRDTASQMAQSGAKYEQMADSRNLNLLQLLGTFVSPTGSQAVTGSSALQSYGIQSDAQSQQNMYALGQALASLGRLGSTTTAGAGSGTGW